jgi:L-ascorbate metabolism protein UlaG (beta-lactamase superfamily)
MNFKKTAIKVIALCSISVAVCAQKTTPAKESTNKPLTLEYIGVMTMVITAPDGTRLVCDPYGDLRPAEIPAFPKNIKADAVTISHFHGCHNNAMALLGKPKQFYDPGEYSIGMIKFTAYKADHGKVDGGASYGDGTIFVYEIAGAKIVHMGGSGLVTDSTILKAMKDADVVIVNALGTNPKPHKAIISMMKDINARTIIPAHYSLSDDNRWFRGKTVNEFIQEVGSQFTVNRTGSIVTVVPNMPTQVLVMKEKVLSK